MSDFSVEAINKSNNDYSFYMFQKSPELEKVGFQSTAWLVTKFKIRKNGGVARFKWSVDYGLQWSEEEQVAPGIIVGQGAIPTSVGLTSGEDNAVDFTFKDRVPQFKNLRHIGEGGSLYINTQNAQPPIPSHTFAFGMTVNNKLAFVTEGQNGVLLTMTPNVRYFLTAADTVVQNQVLSATISTAVQEFHFKDGQNHASVTLASDNTWGDVSYSVRSTADLVEEFEPA